MAEVECARCGDWVDESEAESILEDYGVNLNPERDPKFCTSCTKKIRKDMRRPTGVW